MQVQYRPLSLYGLRSEQEWGPGQQQAPGGHGGGRGAGVMPVLAARSRSGIQSVTSVKTKFKDHVDIEKNFPHHFLLDKTNANVDSDSFEVANMSCFAQFLFISTLLFRIASFFL